MSEECKGCFNPNCGAEDNSPKRINEDCWGDILKIVNRLARNSFERGRMDVVLELYKTGNGEAVSDVYIDGEDSVIYYVDKLAAEHKGLRVEIQKLIDNYGANVV